MKLSANRWPTTILACAFVASAMFAGCSSKGTGTASPSTRANNSTATTTTPRPSPTTRLVVPDTLPDHAFASVADPHRDRSLAGVRVSAVTVAHVDAPMSMVARPGDPSHLFLAERAGRIRLVTLEGSGGLTIRDDALADLSSRISTDGEKGLLGIAFSPDGTTLYTSYSLRNGNSSIDAAPISGTDSNPRIGRFRRLLEADQMGTDIHKGGDLAVDARGLLYIGLGDGGPEDDPGDHAQNPNLLLGKILRIDPAHPTTSKPYGIPAGNPYAQGGGAPEIWLTGLRNPWRFSIDPANGDLWIGDVGQDTVEEIDRLPGGPISAGANLGWSAYEGTHVFDAKRIVEGTVPPIFEMVHSTGVCAVTGGVVYRGHRIPALDGTYLFSDLCRAGVHALRATTPRDGIGKVTDERLLAGTGALDQVISFATDARGEVYTLSLDGSINRLDPAG
ncbi:MAG: PQQ-dependent sugar dehydrogenase [Actinobacteria bacterium]|nr:PQQ-dependent sugar dehydrogenase [Actinomycetota bacterium]